ncbi:MAG: precorrin-2 C(20)-methyltransferase [Cyanobacteria bacterium P01_C01_bin.73]
MTSTSPATLGSLTGIGVGPGDPNLITVKALNHLKSAPVVAFPKGLNGRMGVAQRTITPWIEPHQHQLALQFPYVRDSQQLTNAWHLAAAQVWPYLSSGKDVVFACEGDPSFYGTFTYLAQALHSQHPEANVSAIAGVCSPLAAAAAAGIPLTMQGQTLAVLPALYAVSKLETALTWADVVVLMKVSSVYSEVWSLLQRLDLLACSTVIQQASQTEQVIYADLRQWRELTLPYFSLLIVQPQPQVPGLKADLP